MEAINLKLNEELANWLADLRTDWSGKTEEPCEDYTRFFCYFLGAFTICGFLVFLPVVSVRLGLWTIPTNIFDKLELTILLVVPLVPAVVIALLLSWPKRLYTPARMYLGGLAFAALVCLIMTNVAGQITTQLLPVAPNQ